MIKKIYRLKEREIKKVLKFKKPFFSYNLIANLIKNNLWYNRFALFLSHKNTKTSVSRNFFRRKMYNLVSDSIQKSSFDIVFIPKKWKTFDKKKKEDILGFENDISFLIKKILTL
jgi:ribonuclease P protein component